MAGVARSAGAAAEALAELGLSPAGLDLLTELAQGAKACRCQRRVATIGGSWW